MSDETVVMLNPASCGIYKKGATRFKIDPLTGQRTDVVDNELAEQVEAYLAGRRLPGMARIPLSVVQENGVLVPRYYDSRWLEEFRELLRREKLKSVSLGELVDGGMITVGGGHGSPSNDMRTGRIPYIKVSDVRSLRVNVNPTNLVTRGVAEACWGGPSSGLQGWDLITPNRASANIGEFAVLLPGEEERVLTKEFFVLRVTAQGVPNIDWAYLLWALCLKAVRKQWQRVALMQTNREDVGDRWREILLPWSDDRTWRVNISKPFRDYFGALANARAGFVGSVERSQFEFIASVTAREPEAIAEGADEAQ